MGVEQHLRNGGKSTSQDEPGADSGLNALQPQILPALKLLWFWRRNRLSGGRPQGKVGAQTKDTHAKGQCYKRPCWDLLIQQSTAQIKQSSVISCPRGVLLQGLHADKTGHPEEGM